MNPGESAVYFVGAGALLHHAADYSLSAGLHVAGICCPSGDSATPKLRARGLTVMQSDDPNEDLPRLIDPRGKAVVFSINNRRIIKDELLAAGAQFFNVHNGLVQDYRGIAEVCLFAAVCAGDDRYGATLQRLLPHHKVDSGPIVAQSGFPVRSDERFCDVLPRSLQACRDLFECHVRAISSNHFETRVVGTSKAALRYEDVASLCAGADPARLARACDLGRYRGLLPRLASLIESSQGACGPNAARPNASAPGTSCVAAPIRSGAGDTPS
jgi:folate-dependent phosphoribosylglycinamide formyltransferase PurN